MKISRLAKDSCVFFQCDIQERFRSLIYKMPAVIHVGQQMAHFSGLMRIPLVVTEQYPKALGNTVVEVKSALSTPALIHREKTQFSMCLPDVLKAIEGKKAVVLYGIETHVCIQQTCLDLLERGLQVHLLADGISSQREIDRSAAFVRMREAGAVITTMESIVFELMRSTETPEFKAVSNLLKTRNPDPISHL